MRSVFKNVGAPRFIFSETEGLELLFNIDVDVHLESLPETDPPVLVFHFEGIHVDFGMLLENMVLNVDWRKIEVDDIKVTSEWGAF